MTLQELGNLIIWLGGVSLAFTAIGTFMHFAVIRPLKNWLLDQVAEPLKATEKSLKTSNGQSAGSFIENSSNKLDKIEKELNNLSTQLNVTNQLALNTQHQVALNNESLRKHLMEDHGNVK